MGKARMGTRYDLLMYCCEIQKIFEYTLPNDSDSQFLI